MSVASQPSHVRDDLATLHEQVFLLDSTLTTDHWSVAKVISYMEGWLAIAICTDI